MPLYAYRCTACGASEEHIQKFSDPPKAECSTCGGPLERLISRAAFHLKGGGWYKDGYASNKAEGGKGESSTSSASESGSSPGTTAASSGSSGGSSSGSDGGSGGGSSSKAAAE